MVLVSQRARSTNLFELLALKARGRLLPWTISRKKLQTGDGEHRALVTFWTISPGSAPRSPTNASPDRRKRPRNPDELDEEGEFARTGILHDEPLL
jgi:hypothetical protein